MVHRGQAGIQDGPRSEQQPPPTQRSHSCNPNHPPRFLEHLSPRPVLWMIKREFHETFNYLNSTEIYFQCY